MTETQPPAILLIGGTGRSGSTLLDRLLGELPGFVAVGELRYIWREALADNRYCGCGARFLDCPFWSKVGSQAFGGWDRIDPNEAVALERSIARHRHIPMLAMGDAAPARYTRRLDRYLAMLSPVYQAVRDVSGANVIVDSTKDAAYAHVLRRMPGVDFRVLHLVRDSRGVAWSWAKVVRSDPDHYMRQFSPPVTALRWTIYNLMVESLGWLRIPRLLLRYEALVANPQAALAAVASFAGEPLDSGALHFLDGGRAWLGTHHTVAGNPMRMKTGHITIGLDQAWQTCMPFTQKAQVTALTWPLLRHYSHAAPGPSAAAGNTFAALEETGGQRP
jgi:Sulfotransferase family